MKHEHKSFQGRLDRLKQLFLLGDITEVDYRNTLDDIQSQIDSLPLPAQGRMIDLERAAELLTNIGEIWEKATLEEQEVWFKLMYNKIYIVDGAIKAIEPTPVMSVLFSNIINYDTPSGSDGGRSLTGYAILPRKTEYQQVVKALLAVA